MSVGLATAIPLLAACWLLLDAAAGYAGWQGLRSTNMRPPVTLALAGASLAAFLGLASMFPVSPGVAILAILLALPLHFALSLTFRRSLAPLPWMSAGEWEHHRITAVEIPADDGSVPALVYEPLGDSVGALVLVHGAGAHKTFYSWPIVHTLIDAGFTVCAIDLDGHGDNRRILDFPSVLEGVDATVTWLRHRFAWVGAVGISLGGCVAARAGAEGTRLDALALLEAPAALHVTRRVVRHEWLTLARAATWSLHRYAGTLPLIYAWHTTITRSRISTVDLIRALDLRGSLGRVQCPLGLCYGGSDLVAPPGEARRSAAAAPPGTPLLVVPRATHLSLPLDRRALGALRQWLLDVRQLALEGEPPPRGHPRQDRQER